MSLLMFSQMREGNKTIRRKAHSATKELTPLRLSRSSSLLPSMVILLLNTRLRQSTQYRHSQKVNTLHVHVICSIAYVSMPARRQSYVLI